MLSDWIDRLFGYDFFISYAHADGKKYPHALADGLTQLGFRVFLDEREYAPGAELRAATRRRVRMSSYLVLLARDRALESHWVLREAEECIRATKIPLVIDFDRRFEQLAGDSPIKQVIGERIAITEAGTTETPSQEALAAIARSFKQLRQEQLRTRLLGATVLLFAVIAGLAAWQAWLARQRQSEAEHQTRRATASLLAIQSDRMAVETPITALTLAAAAVRGPLEAGELPPAAAENALRRRLDETDGESFTARFGRLAAVSAGEEWIVSMDDARRLHVFDLAEWDGMPVASIVAPPSTKYLRWHFTVSGDGRWISASRRKEPLLVADLHSEAVWFPLAPAEPQVERVLFDAESRWLAAITEQGPVLVWSLGRPLPAEPAVLEDEHWPDREVAAAFTPDGHLLTSGKKRLARWPLREDGTVGEPLVLAEGGHRLLRDTVDNSGRWLVTRNDRDLWLWDLAAPAPAETARVVPDSFRRSLWAAFSSQYVAVGSDKATFVMALGEEQEPVELPAIPSGGYSSGVQYLRFSRHGRWLFASTSKPEGTHIWSVTGAPPAAAPQSLPQAENVAAARFFYLRGSEQLIVSQFDAVRIFGLGFDGIDFGEPADELRGHDRVVNRLLFANQHRTLLTIDVDGRIQATPYPLSAVLAPALATHGHQRLVSSRSGRWLVGEHDRGFAAWRTANLDSELRTASKGTLRGLGSATTFAIDASERFLVVGARRGSGGDVRLWELGAVDAEGKELARFESEPIMLGFSPHDGSLAVLTQDGELWAWETLAAAPRQLASSIATFSWSETDAELLAFSTTGLMLPEAEEANTLNWDDATRVLAVDPGGRFVVTASKQPAEGEQGGLRLWDRGSREGSRLLDKKEHNLAAAWFSPDRRWLATWRNPGGKLLLWDLRHSDPAKEAVDLGSQFGALDHLRFSADSSKLMVPDGGTVQVWNLTGGPPGDPLVLNGHGKKVTAVAITADGSLVVAGASDGELLLWRLGAGPGPPPLVHIGKHGLAVNTVSLGLDGAWVASSDFTGTIYWPLALEGLIETACARIHEEIGPERWARILPGMPNVTICDRAVDVAATNSTTKRNWPAGRGP